MSDIKKNKFNIKQIIIVACIIAIQLGLLFIWGVEKKEYHIDEIYSYVLSNSYHTDRISNDETIWGNWIEGKDFDKFVTVQEGERFAYDKVYYNNTLDCHPPLFYWLLHTLCSLFPDVFSKWFGLILNAIYFVIAGIFIYLTSKEIVNNKYLKYLPLIFYGFSPFLVDTFLFIRMYMLLTMFAMILIYLHIRMFKYGFNLKKLIFICLTIYLGAMTQYYFLVLSFWAVLICGIYLLTKKEIKKAIIYAASVLVSVGLMFLSYPYIFAQATGTETNNIGNEVTKNLLNFKLWISQCIDLFKSTISRLSYINLISYIIFAMAILLVVLIAIKFFKDKNKIKNISFSLVWMFLVFCLTFLSIAFIGGEFVYLRYIEFIITFLYIMLAQILAYIPENQFKKIKIILAICFGVFIVGNTAFGMRNKSTEYLYQEKANTVNLLTEYSKDKCLVITDSHGPVIPTGNLTILRQFDAIYMDTKKNIENSFVIDECCKNNEFICYITTDTYWLDGFDPDIEMPKIFSGQNVTYQKITEYNFGQYYIVRCN